MEEDTWVLCENQSGLSLIPKGWHLMKDLAVTPLGMPPSMILQGALLAIALQVDGGSRG